MRGHTRENGAAAFCADLTDALLDIPFMHAISDRRLLIHLIRSDAPRLPDIQEHDEARLHTIRIAVACHRHARGLHAMQTVLKMMAPEASGTDRACAMVNRAPLDVLLPEEHLKEGLNLVQRAAETGRITGWREWMPPSVIALTGDAGPHPDFEALLRLTGPAETADHKRTPTPPALALTAQLSGLVDGALARDLRRWTAAQAAWLNISIEGLTGSEPLPSDDLDHKTPDDQPSRPGVDFPDTRSVGLGRISVDLPGPGDPPIAPANDEGADNAEPSSDQVISYTGDSMPSKTAPTLEPLPQVWGSVPSRNQNFTGRIDLLERLHRQLNETRETAVIPQALRGMGGVGKSQLAIEYVHRHSSEYDLVWWISAEQEGQVKVALTSLAERLKIDTTAQANVAVPAVLEALSTGQTGYRRWLLVFDNAESPEDVRPYFPTGGAGKILVTSRNQDWEQSARTLEVDVFSRDESRAYLTGRTAELSPSDADRLAEALGDLPLAVEQAAAWRKATGMPVDEYLELLTAKQADKRLELLRAMSSIDYGLPVAAAWDLSFDRLRERNLAALQLLQICAFLAPEPLSRYLLTGSPAAPILDEVDETLQDPIKLARAIRDIQRYALARYDHQSNTLQMHRLVQQVLVAQMDEDYRATMRGGAQTMLALSNPTNPYDAAQWPRYQSLRPHVVSSEAVASSDKRVRILVLNMVRFLYGWGDHEGCEEMAVAAYAHWSQNLGEDDSLCLQLGQFLGFILWVNGKFAAAESYHRRTLDVYRTIGGDEDEGTLTAMSYLATSRRAAGDFAEALELDEAACRTANRVMGEEDPESLRLAHHLGVSLRLNARFKESYALDRVTHDRRVAVIGPRDPETLRTLVSIGIDQKETGDYLSALTTLKTAHDQALAAFGQDAPITVLAARTLAVGYRKAGDHESARALSEVTLSKLSRRYGDDYPDTMATALNLSIDLRHAGELAEAVKLGEQTLQRYRRLFGERHPHAIAARVNLAVALRASGRVADAYRHDRESYDQLTAVLGPDHASTLVCATNLASDRYADADFQAAYEMDVDTLDRSGRVLGESHPSTLACAVNLALDLRALGRLQEAEKIQSDTMTVFRRALGERHPATLNALQSLRADCDIDPLPI